MNKINIANLIVGYYLDDVLLKLTELGINNLNIVAASPGIRYIPVNMPRVVRYRQVSSDSGTVTIVYEEYLKGGAKNGFQNY